MERNRRPTDSSGRNENGQREQPTQTMARLVDESVPRNISDISRNGSPKWGQTRYPDIFLAEKYRRTRTKKEKKGEEQEEEEEEEFKSFERFSLSSACNDPRSTISRRSSPVWVFKIALCQCHGKLPFPPLSAVIIEITDHYRSVRRVEQKQKKKEKKTTKKKRFIYRGSRRWIAGEWAWIIQRDRFVW